MLEEVREEQDKFKCYRYLIITGLRISYIRHDFRYLYFKTPEGLFILPVNLSESISRFVLHNTQWQ